MQPDDDMPAKHDAATGSRSGKGAPLYRQLADTLRDEIALEVHPVGDLLPTEQDLCERFDTSRYTVREALRLLMEDGLIERRQGRGTEVISARRNPVFAQSLSSLSQLYDYAEDTTLVISSVTLVVPDDTMAMQLGHAMGREWLRVKGVRKAADGTTICITHVFIHIDFADVAKDLPNLTGAIHVAIADRFGVQTDQVHQRITMAPLNSEIASQLGLKTNDWGVMIRRRYLATQDRPILVSLNWHRPDDFNYSQVIRRD